MLALLAAAAWAETSDTVDTGPCAGLRVLEDAYWDEDKGCVIPSLDAWCEGDCPTWEGWLAENTPLQSYDECTDCGPGGAAAHRAYRGHNEGGTSLFFDADGRLLALHHGWALGNAVCCEGHNGGMGYTMGDPDVACAPLPAGTPQEPACFQDTGGGGVSADDKGCRSPAGSEIAGLFAGIGLLILGFRRR